MTHPKLSATQEDLLIDLSQPGFTVFMYTRACYLENDAGEHVFDINRRTVGALIKRGLIKPEFENSPNYQITHLGRIALNIALERNVRNEAHDG